MLALFGVAPDFFSSGFFAGFFDDFFAAFFAGGFFGYLASQPEVTLQTFKHAMFYGGVMGSFAVQRFGTEQMQSLTREEIDQRFALFRELSHLD